MRQAHVGAAQQAVQRSIGKAAMHRSRLQKMLINTAIGKLRAQRLNQAVVPAGMHHAETPGIDKQRQLVEPAEKLLPLRWIGLELLQGFLDQPRMPRRVLAHKLPATARGAGVLQPSALNS